MDTLILIILLVGAIIGYIQGAFKQIANLAGVIVGFLLAVSLYDSFGEYLASATGATESIGNTVAFVIIIILVPIVLGWLASLLTKFFKAVHLSFVNRLAGALIGAICYGLILSVAFNIMDFAKSNGGMHPEKLEERSELFYAWKHAAQWALPDVTIVTDSTEEANGQLPMHGIKSELPPIFGGEK